MADYTIFIGPPERYIGHLVSDVPPPKHTTWRRKGVAQLRKNMCSVITRNIDALIWIGINCGLDVLQETLMHTDIHTIEVMRYKVAEFSIKDTPLMMDADLHTNAVIWYKTAEAMLTHTLPLLFKSFHQTQCFKDVLNAVYETKKPRPGDMAWLGYVAKEKDGPGATWMIPVLNFVTVMKGHI